MDFASGLRGSKLEKAKFAFPTPFPTYFEYIRVYKIMSREIKKLAKAFVSRAIGKVKNI